MNLWRQLHSVLGGSERVKVHPPELRIAPAVGASDSAKKNPWRQSHSVLGGSRRVNVHLLEWRIAQAVEAVIAPMHTKNVRTLTHCGKSRRGNGWHWWCGLCGVGEHKQSLAAQIGCWRRKLDGGMLGYLLLLNHGMLISGCVGMWFIHSQQNKTAWLRQAKYFTWYEIK